MRRILLSVVSLILVVSVLTSCGAKNILKTEEITDKITATKVVLQSGVPEVEDFSSYLNMFTSSYRIPGLFEGIIPQGICYNFNLNWIIIHTIFNSIGNEIIKDSG